jgi:hypothetical protein
LTPADTHLSRDIGVEMGTVRVADRAAEACRVASLLKSQVAEAFLRQRAGQLST